LEQNLLQLREIDKILQDDSIDQPVVRYKPESVEEIAELAVTEPKLSIVRIIRKAKKALKFVCP
jgi:hypothetical protein